MAYKLTSSAPILAVSLCLLSASASSVQAESAGKSATAGSHDAAAAALSAAGLKLQKAFDDALAGKVKEFVADSAASDFAGIPASEKNAIIASALPKAHKLSKQLYRAKKPAEALSRLKLTFDLISFAESGKAPDRAQEPTYFKTWISDWHKAGLSQKAYIAPLNDYGFFLQETGRDKEAVDIFKEVVALQPDREVAYLNLADSLWKLGDTNGANPLYEKYKKLMAAENLGNKVPPRVENNLKATITIPKSGNNTADSKESDFGPFVFELQRRLKQGWFPPIRKISNKVVAVFSILNDGTVDKPSISTSSDDPAVDEAALNAIKGLKAPPLPTKIPQVDIQFTFSYNVHTSEQLVDRWQKRTKDSGTPDNHIGLAQAYEQVQDYTDAEREFKAAIEAAPNNAYYKTLLEKCQKARKDSGN